MPMVKINIFWFRKIWFLFLFLSIISSSSAQYTEKISYAVSLGIFKYDSLKYIYPYLSSIVLEEKHEVSMIKVKKDGFRVFIGNVNCYNEMLPLIDKIRKDGYYGKHTHITAFNCEEEITLKKAGFYTVNYCNENEKQDNVKPIDKKKCFSDSLHYRVFATLHSDSIRVKTLNYLRKNFPKEFVFILVVPSSSKAVYRVFIGNYSDIEKAKLVRNKLEHDGYTPGVREPFTPILKFHCRTKLCGLL